MSESKTKVIKRKRESYRLGQKSPYKLTDEIRNRLISEKELFRFVEDYFHISRDSVYRYVRSNDQALTQLGFLQDLAEKIGLGIHDYETLIEKL